MIVNEFNEDKIIELAQEGLQLRLAKAQRMAERMYKMQEKLRELETQNTALVAIIGRKDW